MNNEYKRWLVTGAAGFIGSHLACYLVDFGHHVVGLDDLSSGHIKNLESIKDSPNFSLIEGDIRHHDICMNACDGVDYVLHHAAIGSVQKSIEAPKFVDDVNNGGFINILLAAKQNDVRRVVYASSSAVYGHEKEEVERIEAERFDSLSPYASSKCANELYAKSLGETHGIETIGLRYFNIYGPRQDPNGAYAAVIPKWIGAMLRQEPIEVYGDGEAVRDFCAVADVVRANMAAVNAERDGGVYNIATGTGTSLNDLFRHLKKITNYKYDPVYKKPRLGDIKRSRANIDQAKKELGFCADTALEDGLRDAVTWYKEHNDV